MVAGIAAALVLLEFPEVKPLLAFPVLMALSAIGAIAGSLLSKPEREDVLVDFYTRTRPWGWWGPIHQAALRGDRQLKANRDFGRDALNVAIGIVWQTAFVALPIYVVIRDWHAAAACLSTILITSAILKRTWYDRLSRD